MPDDVFWLEEGSIWWPKDDRDPQTCFRWVMRHLDDVEETIRRCKRRRTVVQAGGHAGLWPRRLARKFKKVYTFEVQPSLQKACKWNCDMFPNIVFMPIGLGSKAGEAPLRPAGTAGSWRIDPDGQMVAKLMAIDDLKLDDCDAIILDIEGYEVEALKGAIKTIQRCKPIIHVEELDRSKSGIQSFMKAMKYREVKRVHKDAIYVAA